MKYINMVLFMVLAVAFDRIYDSGMDAMFGFSIYAMLFFVCNIVVAQTAHYDYKRHWAKEPRPMLVALVIVCGWGFIFPSSIFIPVLLIQGNMAVRDMKQNFTFE